MLDFLIVDDEAPARSELRFLLEETGKAGVIEEAKSAKEAAEQIIKVRPDVVFLDISMPKVTGLELAQALQKLKRPPAIIFVTAYSEHAVEAFGLDAVDYLLKPVETDRLAKAIEKAELYREHLKRKSSSATRDRIPVEKGGKKLFVQVEDICYIDSKDDYAFLHTEEDNYISSSSLTQLENVLVPRGFLRVHRGHIVNLAQITSVEVGEKGALFLNLKGIDDFKVPVSRRRVSELKKTLGI